MARADPLQIPLPTLASRFSRNLPLLAANSSLRHFSYRKPSSSRETKPFLFDITATRSQASCVRERQSSPTMQLSQAYKEGINPEGCEGGCTLRIDRLPASESSSGPSQQWWS